MKIGPYTISPLSDGTFKLDGGAMFGIVPKSLWNKTNPSDEENRITLGLNLLLIEGKGKKMLVDTGIGAKFSSKYQEIYGIEQTEINLVRSLKRRGIQPEEITDMILTHLHFDHAGGVTYTDLTGGLHLTFPNATHYLQKENWEWAIHPNDREKKSYLPENIFPIKEMGNLVFVEGEAELYEGISVLVSNGHTRGQQLVKVSDGENTLLYCGDLIPTASHINPPYIMGYDLFPLTMLEEKQRVLSQAVKENWVLFWEHDPFCPAGRIVCTEGRYGLREKLFLS